MTYGHFSNVDHYLMLSPLISMIYDDELALQSELMVQSESLMRICGSSLIQSR